VAGDFYQIAKIVHGINELLLFAYGTRMQTVTLRPLCRRAAMRPVSAVEIALAISKKLPSDEGRLRWQLQLVP
jgi:hypothetical protein